MLSSRISSRMFVAFLQASEERISSLSHTQANASGNAVYLLYALSCFASSMAADPENRPV